MAQEDIIIGPADAKDGDTYFDAFTKTQNNFTEIYNDFKSDTVHFINDESQLPNIVGDASTLVENNKYILSSGLVLTKRLIATEGCHIAGMGTLTNAITYNGTGDFITSNNVTFQISDFDVFAPNCNQVFNCTGTLPTLHTVFVNGMRIRNAPKIGTFNTAIPIFENFVSLNHSDGFTFTGGPVIGLLFDNSFFVDGDPGSVTFNLGSATFLDFVIHQTSFDGVGTIFSSSVNGANIVASAQEAEVTLCNFNLTGSMTVFSGFTDGFQTNGWNFTDNAPLSGPAQADKSRELGEAYLTTSNTVTISNTTDYFEIGVPASGAWASDINDRFSLTTDGVLTYTGTKQFGGSINASATIEKVGGGADTLEFTMAKNWSATPGVDNLGYQKAVTQTDNPTPASVLNIPIDTVQPNDNFRPIFRNTNSTSNIIVSKVIYNIRGE